MTKGWLPQRAGLLSLNGSRETGRLHSYRLKVIPGAKKTAEALCHFKFQAKAHNKKLHSTASCGQI